MTTGSFGIGWRQVASGFVMLACVATITSSYSVIAVPLAAEFKPSRAVLMLAMTVLSGMSAILSPLLGGLMDKAPLKQMMLTGAVLLSAGYAALTFADSFSQILLVYALLIAPANVLLGPVAVTVLLSRWFVKRRGTALGIAIAGISMGGILFPPVIQGFLNSFPWREGVRMFALVILVLTVAAAAIVVDNPAKRGLQPDGAARVPGPAPVKRSPLSTRAIVTDPAFWLIFVMVAVVTSGMKGMVTNLAPLAVDQGITPTAAAFLVSIFASCSLVAKLVFATVSDRINLRYLAIGSLLGFASGMLVLTQAQLGYLLIAGGVGVVGLFGGLMVPLESLLGARVFGREAVGKAIGLLSMVMLVALLSTPPLFGLIFDLTGSYSGIFYTFGGLAVLATVVVPYVRFHARDAEAPEEVALPAEAAATTS